MRIAHASLAPPAGAPYRRTMDHAGSESGFQVRLTEAGHAGWRALADEHGMTTSGLLEMIGRQVAADPRADIASILASLRPSAAR